jgi:hypothetical protein
MKLTQNFSLAIRKPQWSKTWTIAVLCCISISKSSSESATRLDRIDHWRERESRQRAFPLETIPRGARQRALKQIENATQHRSTTEGGGGSFHWFNVGPTPIHDTTSADAVGRVTAIAVDPGSQPHWLVGTAQGGIWESTDGGLNWGPRSDDQPSLAIGAIAFAPSNPQIVYAGTGEASFSRVSYAGMGLLKSLDGGASWFVVAHAPFSETAFSTIRVHPSNPNSLMAATARGVLGEVAAGTNVPPTAPPRGIFRSQNGGTSWTQTLFGEATDLEVDPFNFNRQYAALGEVVGAPTNGVYRSIDGGVNWTFVNGPWMSVGPTNVGRIEMALAPSNPNRLCVSVAFLRSEGGLAGIWRTDNAWATNPSWTEISTSGSPEHQPFPWYSHDLIIHPNNPDVVYFGGLTVWRYNGSSWVELKNHHPDQHAFAWAPTFDPSVYRIIAVHDGGISSRIDNSSPWVSHVRGLTITQFYKGAVDLNGSSLFLGGSQDNGTAVYNGDPTWNAVFGGDGFSCTISPSNPDKHWAVSHQEHRGDTIFRTKDGKNFNTASFGIDASTISFFIDFVRHPAQDNLFVAGAINLWRCENFFSATSPTWTSNGPVLFTSAGPAAEITAIAFAPSDTLGRTYAYGTEDGQLRLTADAGANWGNIDAGDAVPGRFVSGLAFSPANPQELYVTLSGFDEGTPGRPGHLFKTTNALAANPSWSNISPPVNLPQDCIAINPLDPLEIFVGSDIGVWRSGNAGQSWTHLGPLTGMPNVAVFDLQFDNFGHLTAFTHGRGAFVYRRLPFIAPPLCKLGPCWPRWLNPQDLVTIFLPLRNDIPIPTIDLIARLRPTSHISPLGGSQVQNYGSLSAAGPTVIRPFQFQLIQRPGLGDEGIPPLRCGDIVHATFDLEDGSESRGSIDIPFRVGRLSEPLTQDFELAAPPMLPTGWSSSGPHPWPWTTTTNAPPNVIVAGGDPDEVRDQPPPTSGPVSVSAFAPDPPSAADTSLYSPRISLATDRAQLTFRHSFDVERNYDGGVLEIAIGTEPFTDIDIVQGGAAFSDNGYNTTLFPGTGPLGGRAVWSGNSGGWIITEVNLPPRAAGQTVQFRWRLATDGSVGGNGWFIDDVAVNEFPCVPPVTNPIILRPGRYGTQFGFFVETAPSRLYQVEFKDALNDPAWHFLQTLQGDGGVQFVGDPTLGTFQRFYRFRVE